jgi:parvulin-like peptidyl-prolyl isomerase
VSRHGGGCRHLYLSCAWVVNTLLVASCGTSDDELVAQVGTYRITARQYRSYVEGLPGRWQPDKTGDEARLHHLQVLIDRCLLLMEGESLGLDTLAAVQQATAKAVDEYVVARYQLDWSQSQPDISEQEIESVFRAEGFDRERLGLVVRVRTRTEIDTILAELRSGVRFDEIARSRSMDRGAVEADGGLGFLDRDQAARLGIPPSLFLSLPLDKTSPPLPIGTDWQVVRFVEDRPTDYDRYREPIRAQLAKRQRSELEQLHIEELTATMGVRRHEPGLRMVVAALRTADPSSIVSSSLTLYEVGSSRIEVSSAAQALAGLQLEPESADSARVSSLLQRHVLRPALLQAAAREAGFYDGPEFRRARQKGREEAILEMLRLRTNRSIHISTDEVRRYYDTHQEVFRHEEALWIEEMLLATAAEALRVRQQIEAGARFADLAVGSLRDKAEQQRGRLHFHAEDQARHPQLMPAAQATEAGLVAGPLRVKGGFSVFRVLGRSPGRVDSFDAVQDRARAILRERRQQGRLSVMLERLRAQHSSVIQVHAPRLQMAVPDYLLGG